MKKLIVILLIVLMMLLTMTACATKRSREVVKGNVSRMIVVEDAAGYYIVYDKYTKVMYAVSNSAYNNGNFTLLVDAAGNPLLYEGQEERSE